MSTGDKYYWTGTNSNGAFSMSEDIYIPKGSPFEVGSLVIEVSNNSDKADVNIFEVDPSGELSTVEKIGRDNILELISDIAAKKISNGDIRLFNEAVRLELFEKIEKVFKEVEDKYGSGRIKISKEDAIE